MDDLKKLIRRDNATRTRIANALEELSEDELLVFDVLVKKMIAGKRKYGQLDLSTDERNYSKEASEEAADMINYLVFAMIKLEKMK